MTLQRPRTRRGSNAVEFAMLFPILFAAFTWVLDVGWYITVHQGVASAVREGARAGSVTPFDEDPAAAAATRTLEAMGSAGVGDAPLELDAVLIGDTPRVLVRVTADVDYEPLFGLTPSPSAMRYELSFRLEDQPPADD